VPGLPSVQCINPSRPDPDRQKAEVGGSLFALQRLRTACWGAGPVRARRVALAVWLKNRDPAPPPKRYSWEDEEEVSDEEVSEHDETR